MTWRSQVRISALDPMRCASNIIRNVDYNVVIRSAIFESRFLLISDCSVFSLHASFFVHFLSFPFFNRQKVDDEVRTLDLHDTLDHRTTVPCYVAMFFYYCTKLIIKHNWIIIWAHKFLDKSSHCIICKASKQSKKWKKELSGETQKIGNPIFINRSYCKTK